MFLLGSRFDEDPQLPWASRCLAQRGDIDARLSALGMEVRAYVHTVAGNTGERYRRAFAAARRLPAEAYAAWAIDDGSVLALMETLHPEKLAYLDDLGELVSLAKDKARTHALPLTGRGALVIVANMVLLGSHFDLDPIHPWAGEVLTGSLDPAGKATALRERGLEELSLYFRQGGV
jgi:hypothetical protein